MQYPCRSHHHILLLHPLLFPRLDEEERSYSFGYWPWICGEGCQEAEGEPYSAEVTLVGLSGLAVVGD